MSRPRYVRTKSVSATDVASAPSRIVGGMFTTDVLVVGAGPAGLATAVSALRHGARVLVVERSGRAVDRAAGDRHVDPHHGAVARLGGRGRGAAREHRLRPDGHVTRASPTRRRRWCRWPGRRCARCSPRARRFPPLCPRTTSSRCWSTRCAGAAARCASVRRSRRCGRRPTGCARSSAGGRCGPGSWSGPTGRAAPCATALGIGWERLGVIGEFTLTLFRAARHAATAERAELRQASRRRGRAAAAGFGPVGVCASSGAAPGR